MSDPTQPWQTLTQEVLFAAPPWLTLLREAVQLPSGKVISDFYRLVLPEFAMVLAQLSDGRYLLVRGYKHGLGRVTLAPPGGMIEPGETPLAAAQRELLEETGHVAEDWLGLGRFVVDANRQCGTMHLFVARAARPATSVTADESEPLRIERLTRDELLAALRQGETGNLAAAAAISLGLLLG